MHVLSMKQLSITLRKPGHSYNGNRRQGIQKHVLFEQRDQVIKGAHSLLALCDVMMLDDVQERDNKEERQHILYTTV